TGPFALIFAARSYPLQSLAQPRSRRVTVGAAAWPRDCPRAPSRPLCPVAPREGLQRLARGGGAGSGAGAGLERKARPGAGGARPNRLLLRPLLRLLLWLQAAPGFTPAWVHWERARTRGAAAPASAVTGCPASIQSPVPPSTLTTCW